MTSNANEQTEAIRSRIYHALSDETRRKILDQLAEQDARVGDLAGVFPVSLNAISKHIKVLEAAGLVRRRIDGREHWLALDPSPLSEVDEWSAKVRTFWSKRLDALDHMLDQEEESRHQDRDAKGSP